MQLTLIRFVIGAKIVLLPK